MQHLGSPATALPLRQLLGRVKLSLGVGLAFAAWWWATRWFMEGATGLGRDVLIAGAVGAFAGATVEVWAWVFGSPWRAAPICGLAVAAITIGLTRWLTGGLAHPPPQLTELIAWSTAGATLVGGLSALTLGPWLRNAARRLHGEPAAPESPPAEGAPPLFCSACKRQALDNALLRPSPSARGANRPLVCSRCWSRQQRSNDVVGLLVLLAVALATAGYVLFRPEASPGFVWFTLNLVLVFLFVNLLVVPHELGHAAGAWLMGLRVFQVYVGFGLSLFSHGRWGLWRERQTVPWGFGQTVVAHPDPRHFRRRHFLMVLGGPLVHALMLGAVLAWQTPAGLLGQAPDLSEGVSPGLAFAAANALLLVAALFPHNARIGEALAASDGLKLLTVPFLPEAAVRQSHAMFFLLEAQDSAHHRDYAAVRRWYERWLECYPDDALAKSCLAANLLHFREFEKARRMAGEVLARTDLEPLAKAHTLDVFASADLLLLLDEVRSLPDAVLPPESAAAPADLLQEAEEANRRGLREARQIPPLVPSVLLTRGWLLVERGLFEEARGFLAELIDELASDYDRAACEALLAVAAAGKGDAEGARRHLETARALHSDCVILPGVERRLAPLRPAEAAVAGTAGG